MSIIEACFERATKFTAILNKRSTFEEAESLCATVQGRTLARINSNEENMFVQQLFNDEGFGTDIPAQLFWIGKCSCFVPTQRIHLQLVWIDFVVQGYEI